MRAAGACRRLQALSRASVRLWASARLSLVGVADAERCAAWLAARRALLRRLWLAGPRPAPSQRYRGFHGSREVSQRVDHVMSEAERLEAADAALLEALRGAPLSALHREAATPLRLGADLSPWRQLRWLSLAAPHISLPADLAWQLPALTTLHLRCNSPPLELLPDRLPPGLLELVGCTSSPAGTHHGSTPVHLRSAQARWLQVLLCMTAPPRLACRSIVPAAPPGQELNSPSAPSLCCRNKTVSNPSAPSLCRRPACSASMRSWTCGPAPLALRRTSPQPLQRPCRS